jgi:hypothetical protein
VIFGHCRALGEIALAGSLAFAAACSREEDKSRTLDLSPAFARYSDGGAPASAAAPSAKSAPKDEPWPSDVDASRPHPLQVIVTRTFTVDAGSAAPKPPNPDDAVLERARVAARACFRSLSAGAGEPPERSAHVVFAVIPTGMVSTADVSSEDTNDDSVLRCIHEQALKTVFSDNGGGPLRTYAIDIRVVAKL